MAVIVATAVGFIIGGIWYGPLFGDAWMSAIGKTADQIQPSPAPFVISFFTALITAIVLAMLINALNISTLGGGVVIGLLVGVGFIATAMASDAAFGDTGLKLWLIQSGYRVLYSVVMGAILAVWR
ncbi:MAG: DUF1761 domain-containing protein [Gemmatimonadetes bacterium]|nr:DUF1761 domain-containing protein [Gemmatimonadota bacterium]